MSNFRNIPVINIAALRSDDPAGRRLCAKRIGRACREIGFFYVVSHGVDRSLVAQAFAASAAFFALPTEVKSRTMDKSRRHRGYFTLGSETTNPSAGPDWKEGFDISLDWPTTASRLRAGKALRRQNQWPAAPAGFRPVMTAYYKSLCELGTLISRAFDLALGLPEDFFASHLKRPTAILRVLHYPGNARTATRAAAVNGHIAAGAHTDNGYLTILAQDKQGGLQVRNVAGRWIDAVPIEGSFVCNIGDMMALWTNNMMRATQHRVIHRSLNSRYSIPFFFHPDLGLGRQRREPLLRKNSVRFLV
ncbi:MAG TPA: 2-oxoglutarate and iron-dependent oxygenase domain-containing protein [Candidatus Acidoferrales bacterium]|nr:2-oxoglutarate and iron-dependent oxygenase domain-containing protein [Candidatus Acidoferrales bacterium]